ncbi:MAG: prepilin-type N-terminal cleavage/methylation domain-containing protein [Smithellaceae bacterium]|nr:prepilin-type N-terminal cleavage/methylation domain-containing protein [Smithellaceae bacterium]
MNKGNKGYTLIELIVVVAVVGVVLFVALPRLRDDLLNDSLDAAARRIEGTVRELRNDALREQLDYVLEFDLNDNSFYSYATDMTAEKRQERQKDAYHLRGGARIVDCAYQGGQGQTDGQFSVHIYGNNCVQPTVIHLQKDDRYLTLYLQPFLNSVDRFEGAVEVTAVGKVEGE